MTRLLLRVLGPLALVAGAGLLGFWQGSAAEAAPPPAPTVTVDLSGLNRAVAVGEVRVLGISPQAAEALRQDRPDLRIPHCGGLTGDAGLDFCIDEGLAQPVRRPVGSHWVHPH